MTMQLKHNVDRIDVEPVNKKEKRELYKAREQIYPKRVSGFFRSFKWWVMILTLGIYYITPWLRWDRGPYAPDQAVLVDLANGRFYFFFIEIWPQELFYVAGLLIMAGIGLFLITSTVGRAWCGYSCPQTVWVDLFLLVERRIEGDRNTRIKLDKAPWGVRKFSLKTFKHFVWILISLSTGGAWIFYFADAPKLAYDFITFSAAPVAYSTVALLTATTYVLAGYMREQVCTYMCPWPRIQGAMLDEDSLVVTYHDWRGEPRSKHQKSKKNVEAPETSFGDCIDCNQCVAVCPMGIDIRDGQQMECITCALCIDACDNVMEKINKPKGLIAYSTLYEYNGACNGNPTQTSLKSFIRPRTLIYTALWSFAGLAMIFMLLTRDKLDLNVLHDRNPVFVQLSDGSVRNGYTVRILNMKPLPRVFTLRLEGLKGAKMKLAGSNFDPRESIDIAAGPDDLATVKVYIQVKKSDLKEKRNSFKFVVADGLGEETAEYNAKFVGP